MSTSRSNIEEAEVQLLSFLTLELHGSQLTYSLVRITPVKEQSYPLNRRVVGPHRRSERLGGEEYILSLRGFEFRTLRIVA
jgi:hypothetical protein